MGAPDPKPPARPQREPPGHGERGACPILGAKWERQSTVSCGQKRSDSVSAAACTCLTWGNVVYREPYSPGRSVVVLGIGNSSSQQYLRSSSGLLHVRCTAAAAPGLVIGWLCGRGRGCRRWCRCTCRG